MQPIPTINVNLKQCTCVDISPTYLQETGGKHHLMCYGTPVLIPCPIQRSATFEVRLGECACNAGLRGFRGQLAPHTATCPARPIRVTCSIYGKTWAESEPVEAACDATQWQPSWSPANEAFLLACRERWALVKALVLGKTAAQPGIPLQTSAATIALFVQRDAVFSALADKARAEQADDATTREVIKLVPRLKARDVSVCTAEDYISARALAAYVERIVEQVGVLE